jgi:outer membrane immunogenic protein
VKRSLLASTALCAVFASAASAKDLPPAPGATPFSWTGFYVGANLGGQWSHDGATNVGQDYFSTPGESHTLTPSGALGGVQAGYNQQIQNFVLGVEGDLDWSSARSRVGPVFGDATPVAHSSSFPFFADLRGRVGFAFDRFLPYVTGGVVFADLRDNLEGSSLTPTSIGRGEAIGWTIGAGAEYAIGGHWSVKADFLHVQVPDRTAVFDNTKKFQFKDSADILRLGLNFRF